MLNLILCGAPGSGKGTQSAFIAEKYGLEHLSTGDVLRREIASGSALGKEIDELIAGGNLVPDAKMIRIIEHFIDSRAADCKGIIFDGYPRTVEQAVALEDILEKRGMSATMLDLWVDEEKILTRLLERGKISGRADDNEQTIKKRLEVFHAVTKSVCYFYLRMRNYFAINGNGTMEETFAQIDAIVGLLSNK